MTGLLRDRCHGETMTDRNYTCREYRQEMQLLALKRRLEDRRISDGERTALVAEIRRLETEMNME